MWGNDKKQRLFINANIYTLKNEDDKYSAMLIEEGRIKGLYNNIEEINKDVETVDCGGKTIIPSFSDAHLHFNMSVILKGSGLIVSEITEEGIYPTSLNETRKKISKYISKNNSDTVLCYNYMACAIEEQRLPTRFELEQWFPNKTISIISMDSHSSVHTSQVLKFLGIYDKQHNGILDGESHEFNAGRMFEFYKRRLVSFKSAKKSIEIFLNELIGYGITDISCLEGGDDEKTNLSLWTVVALARMLKITFRLFPQLTNIDRVDKLSRYMKNRKVGGCGSWEMDGAIGSKTAAFDIPYLDDDTNFGKTYYSQDKIKNIIYDFDLKGFQTLVHAIGTTAINYVIGAYQALFNERKYDINKKRHRIEHFEFPLEEHIQKAIDMQLCVSVQPGYAWMDYNFQHSYEKWINKELHKRLVPLKRLYESGVHLLGSSDSPVQDTNPFIQIYGMVNYPLKEQKLTVYQALRTYTYNNAYANFSEKEKGTLKIGKKADFIILDRDPFKTKKDKIINIKVIHTFIEGQEIKEVKLNLFKLLNYSKKV